MDQFCERSTLWSDGDGRILANEFDLRIMLPFERIGYICHDEGCENEKPWAFN